MRFGFGTVLWGRRIDDLDYCLDVIAACGYKGVEFAQHHEQIFIREGEHIRGVDGVAELVRKLDDRGLDLIGLVGGTLKDRAEFLDTHRGCYLYLDRWPEEDKDPEFHAQVQSCLAAGHVLALHPHWLMPMCKCDQAIDIIKAQDSPQVRLLLDTAHATIAEDDPVDVAAKRHALLACVHLKSWRPDYGRWSHRYAHGFCLPGDGIVKVSEVMDALHQVSYKGWVVLEQDHFADRRERTALHGAQWMSKHGEKWGLHVQPDLARVGVKIAEERKNPFVSHEGVESKQATLARSLARRVEHHHSGRDFYHEVAEGLLSLLQVMAVKVWSHNPLTNEFCLLGIAARMPTLRHCESILSNRCSLVAEIVQHPHICERNLDEPKVILAFSDKDWLQLVKQHGACWMTVLPVFNSSNPHQLRFLITAFSEDSLLSRKFSSIGTSERLLYPMGNDGDLKQVRSGELERYGWVVSHWADHLTNEICTAAAGATNHLCGEFKSGGVMEFINELTAHLKKRFDCNCVTLFLEDTTGKLLEPAGESDKSLIWSQNGLDGNEVDHHYLDPDDRKHYTWKAWKQRRMVFSSTAKDGKAREQRKPEDEDRDEILFAPLTRRLGKCHGVVRLHNKHRVAASSEASMFTDDDAAHLDAVIQAALPHLELLRHREQEMEGMTRMVHEFQAPLGAIRMATDAMRLDLKRNGHVPEQFFRQDFLGMVMDWAELMGHLARNAHVFAAGIATLPPQKRRTLLRTAVVLPVLHQVKPLLKHGMRLEFDYHGFEDIPPLWIDRGQFQCVFFNLMANACKYGAGTETVRVSITAGEVGGNYCISFSDWGQGVPEDIKEKVFLPKFRSKEALLADVSGMGLGLYVVRSIIEAHGGRIRVSRTHLPTTFEITLPSSLRHAPSPARP